MSEKIPTEIQDRIKQFSRSMLEHVDSIRIFVTVHDGEKAVTSSFDWGQGNIHAQQGQIDEWLRIQKEFQRAFARRKDAEDNQHG